VRVSPQFGIDRACSVSSHEHLYSRFALNYCTLVVGVRVHEMAFAFVLLEFLLIMSRYLQLTSGIISTDCYCIARDDLFVYAIL
jgi:hypothetical protein